LETKRSKIKDIGSSTNEYLQKVDESRDKVDRTRRGVKDGWMK